MSVDSLSLPVVLVKVVKGSDCEEKSIGIDRSDSFSVPVCAACFMWTIVPKVRQLE